MDICKSISVCSWIDNCIACTSQFVLLLPAQVTSQTSRDVEVAPRSIQQDLKLLKRHTVAVPSLDRDIIYMDKCQFEDFHIEHQEDMYWWCLYQYDDNDIVGGFSYELNMIQCLDQLGKLTIFREAAQLTLLAAYSTKGNWGGNNQEKHKRVGRNWNINNKRPRGNDNRQGPAQCRACFIRHDELSPDQEVEFTIDVVLRTVPVSKA
ncbi:hypothetical protein FNV43_RR13344 [Rhamnella rubrinervis]|uniref:Uncharacterized protein n=1 Tax=Rhamnella rubrinervis TaxID=2594499 RepID=A0A8K0H0X0_9ROSA|nr:hypothetical protein FNV43_RR13344 [Rhamnella rubrinervis]